MLLNFYHYRKRVRAVQAEMDIEQRRIPYGPHRRQYSVVIRNRDPAARDPSRYAFYFHGGAWTFGRPEAFTPAALPWLAHGFTVVLPSYRRPPLVGLNRIVQDCFSAVGSFAKEATPKPTIHIGGISAGAHLAAVLATETDWWKNEWGAVPEKVLCCGGPLSLALLKSSRLLLPRYAAIDAIQRVPPADPDWPQAWQLSHGDRDPVVDYRHSVAFLSVLRARGYVASLHTLPGGLHLDSGHWMFGEAGREVVDELIRPR